MSLQMKGTVSSVQPTKGGKWLRVIVPGKARINDLLMVAADGPPIKEGDKIDLPVRAQVETTADGRPMKSIVYWLDDGGRPVVQAPAAS